MNVAIIVPAGIELSKTTFPLTTEQIGFPFIQLAVTYIFGLIASTNTAHSPLPTFKAFMVSTPFTRLLTGELVLLSPLVFKFLALPETLTLEVGNFDM